MHTLIIPILKWGKWDTEKLNRVRDKAKFKFRQSGGRANTLSYFTMLLPRSTSTGHFFLSLKILKINYIIHTVNCSRLVFCSKSFDPCIQPPRSRKCHLCCLSSNLPHPQPWHALICFPEGQRNGSIRYVAFWVWLPSFSSAHLRAMLVVSWVHSFFLLRSVPLCGWPTVCPSLASGHLSCFQFWDSH